MSSSPSASLTLDFLGLSLVDTPPSDKKGKAKRPIQNESRADARHSRPIVLDDDDDDDILESSCDDRDDPTMNATSDRNRYYTIDSTLEEEEDDEEDSILEHIDESEQDPVWILQSEKNGYILNDQCTSYDTAIQWPRMTLSRKMHTKLYPHQKIGVRWLASLHHRAEKFGVGGGILGDDMGLGKTMQTLALIGGLFRCQTIRNALVVCPVSVVQSWKNEADQVFDLCGLSSIASVMIVDSNCRKGLRASKLKFAMVCGKANPCLVITTYGLLKTNVADFLSDDDSSHSKCSWDYVILDEGQCIKNNTTLLHKSCSRLASNPQTRRLLLTGTPIQNNLKELWALFDWVTQGKLLGKQQTFSNQYAIPIENGRNKECTEWTLRTAEQANKRLQTALEPHLLQRLKEVELQQVLTRKKELVVWTHLSASQRQLYENYLVDSGKVTAVLSGEKSSPLEAISWLKKLCAHPCLVDEQLAESCTNSLQFLEHSAKLQVLVDLVHRLNKSGHRFLIFSQSTKMLDIIAQVVHLSLARIDGSTKNRQTIVDSFNRADSSFDGMLLSTKAAGIGLTLTGADRAIIYDPSWNPSDDLQAADRLYRIGQNQNVTIYRFIAAGTVEERMYEKQVYKDGIRRTVLTTSDANTARYFSRDELTQLFKLMPAGECNMIQRLRHDPEAVIGGSGKISILANHPKVVGVTSHDSLYDLASVERQKQMDLMAANIAATKISNVEGQVLSSNQTIAIDPKDSASHLKAIAIDPKDSTSHSKDPENELEQLLHQIDDVTQSGDIDESLSLLLYATTLEACKGPSRLLIHKKIAARAVYLGLFKT